MCLVLLSHHQGRRESRGGPGKTFHAQSLRVYCAVPVCRSPETAKRLPYTIYNHGPHFLPWAPPIFSAALALLLPKLVDLVAHTRMPNASSCIRTIVIAFLCSR